MKINISGIYVASEAKINISVTSGVHDEKVFPSASAAVIPRRKMIHRMKILILNGPNINMLGIREPDIYGKKTYADTVGEIEAHAAERGVEVTVYQSNHEGDLVDIIQQAYGIYDGIVINPGGYTHTSVAIPDALKAVSIPTVEVHISRVDEREAFRRINYVRGACEHTISGHGTDGYLEAIDYLVEKYSKSAMKGSDR